MSDDVRSWLSRTIGAPAPRPEASAGAARSAPPIADAEEAGYKAFGHGHPESMMIDVRLAPEEGETVRCELLPLHHLMRASYSGGPLGDHVTLHFADCLVTASGRHLGDLHKGLLAGKIGFIEEHDAKRWPVPASGQPIILRIEIQAPGRQAQRRSA